MFTARPASSPQRPKKPYNPNAVCDFCHMKGHLRIDCLKLLNCDFCHKTGHLKLNCYKLNGYPLYYKGKREVVVAGNSMYDRRVRYKRDSMTMAPYQQCPPLSPYYIPPPQPPGSTLPMFTSAQHQKLLHMLNQSSINDTQGTANMAGQIDNAGHVQMPTGTSAKVSHIGDCHIGGVTTFIVPIPLSPSTRIVPEEVVQLQVDEVATSVKPTDVIPATPMRKSSRSVRPPIWHKDYVTKASTNG
ncbi:hypothetical protein H5410_053682 [Solanum commersonii]|uniref:Uncharacterized protein n=1 Tax=Solanum commersonii TaxID=4109 RepID=A0A9J5X5K1_SOLCO|nr:hypothetical protein H5410_053682 [Solanum commersonii]